MKEIQQVAVEEIKQVAVEEIKEAPTAEIKEVSVREIQGLAEKEIQRVAEKEIQLVAVEEIKEAPTGEIKQAATAEIKQAATAEIKQAATAEIKQAATAEIKHLQTGTVEINQNMNNEPTQAQSEHTETVTDLTRFPDSHNFKVKSSPKLIEYVSFCENPIIVTLDDLKTLEGREWLSDPIVDFYLDIIHQGLKPSLRKDVFICPCLFIQMMKTGTWPRPPVNIFDKECKINIES